jgi:ketosteroid isomerase-like protein
MGDAAMRQLVGAYYDALAARDADAAGVFLDDDVELMLYGPVDLFPFFGRRRGKAAVVQNLRESASYMDFRRYQVEHLLVDGNDAAVFVHAAAEVIATGRVISWRMAHFVHFENGKITRLQYVCDTFDMFEQAIGHELVIA